MSGVLAVTARIAGIQAQLATLAAPAPARPGTAAVTAGAPATAPAAVTGTGAAGGGFAAALQQALGGPAGTGSATATTATVAAPGRSGPDGGDLVGAARRYLGVPYRWGGTDPATGLDCSGLVQRAMRDLGVQVPRTSAEQSRIGTAVPSLAQARPGDLVFLSNPNHIGIYVGDGKMLHAPRTGDVVKISTVWETPAAIRRVLPGEAAQAAAGSGATSAAGSPTGSTGAQASTAAALRLGAPSSLAPMLGAAEARHGLPTGLLSAVARAESGFRTSVVSHAGAVGLMQIMPGTARELKVDARVPSQAVDGAARLLASHLERFGTVPLALAAYNAGPGAVSRHGGVPPYRETQDYVRKITAMLPGGAR